MSELFLVDDFFVAPDDEGVEISPKIRGREVPMKVKSGISVADREYAKSKALKKRITEAGKIEVIDFNEGVFNVELLSRCLVSWPFKARKRDEAGNVVQDAEGQPVLVELPITADNITRLFADGADAISAEIEKILARKQADINVFVKASEEA